MFLLLVLLIGAVLRKEAALFCSGGSSVGLWVPLSQQMGQEENSHQQRGKSGCLCCVKSLCLGYYLTCIQNPQRTLKSKRTRKHPGELSSVVLGAPGCASQRSQRNQRQEHCQWPQLGEKGRIGHQRGAQGDLNQTAWAGGGGSSK